jgi:hypothetical protein
VHFTVCEIWHEKGFIALHIYTSKLGEKSIPRLESLKWLNKWQSSETKTFPSSCQFMLNCMWIPVKIEDIYK